MNLEENVIEINGKEMKYIGINSTGIAIGRPIFVF